MENLQLNALKTAQLLADKNPEASRFLKEQLTAMQTLAHKRSKVLALVKDQELTDKILEIFI